MYVDVYQGRDTASVDSALVQGNDLPGNFVIPDLENPHRDGIIPTTGHEGCPGIEKKNPIPVSICRVMCVAVNNAVDVVEFPSDPVFDVHNPVLDVRRPAITMDEADPKTPDRDYRRAG